MAIIYSWTIVRQHCFGFINRWIHFNVISENCFNTLIAIDYFLNKVVFCTLGGESTQINIFVIALRRSFICIAGLCSIGVENHSSTVIRLCDNPPLYHLLLIYVPAGVTIETSSHFNCMGVMGSSIDKDKW